MPDNAGNSGATGMPDNAGNSGATGMPDNAGNSGATGMPDNAGNTSSKKKKAEKKPDEPPPDFTSPAVTANSEPWPTEEETDEGILDHLRGGTVDGHKFLHNRPPEYSRFGKGDGLPPLPTAEQIQELVDDYTTMESSVLEDCRTTCVICGARWPGRKVQPRGVFRANLCIKCFTDKKHSETWTEKNKLRPLPPPHLLQLAPELHDHTVPLLSNVEASLVKYVCTCTPALPSRAPHRSHCFRSLA
jgi:hypothetical protein